MKKIPFTLEEHESLANDLLKAQKLLEPWIRFTQHIRLMGMSVRIYIMCLSFYLTKFVIIRIKRGMR
jgi:hypothetical protein